MPATGMAKTASGSMENLARDIRMRLEAQADRRYRSSIGRLVPTGIEIIGVPVPTIRKLARSFAQDHAGVTMADLVRLLDRAFAARCREEVLFATLLIAARRAELPSLPWEAIESWVGRIEDWEVCDQLSTAVVGEIVAGDLARVEGLVRWARSPGRWRRRAAAAASTRLNRKGRRHAAEALRICEPLMTDDDRMVEKAVAWALREASGSDGGAVAGFLAEWKGRASPRLLRAGSKKLDAARRHALLGRG